MSAADTSKLLKMINAGSKLMAAKQVANGGVNTTWEKHVIAKEPGTIRFLRGGRKLMEWWDRGELQIPFTGDVQPCELGFSTKNSGFGATGDLYKYIVESPDIAGQPQLITFGLWIPDSRVATTGDLTVFANCAVDADSIKFAEGREFDALEFVFKDYEPTGKPTVTTAQSAPA